MTLPRNLWVGLSLLLAAAGLLTAQLPAPPAPDGKPHFWAAPEEGWQTVYVLRVIDGDTIEAARLVPFVARIHGVNAPELHTPAGPPSKAALEAMVAGKLLLAWLGGREKYGRTLLDLHTGADGWTSDRLVKGGWAKSWDGKGPRP